jgi:hypothetical protein
MNIEEIKKNIQLEQSSLEEQYGDVEQMPCSLNLGQDGSGIYLSTQQIDMILLVNISSVEEFNDFIKECHQLPMNFSVEDVTEENLEEKKRELFEYYKSTYDDFRDYLGYSKANAKKVRVERNIKRLNLPRDIEEAVLNGINNNDLQRVCDYISVLPNGEDIINRINRFIVLDYENVKSISYEEILELSELLKRDASIDTIISIGAKYDMTMKCGLDGKMHFDSYFLDRALKLCKLFNKHMRYHSLFDRSTAEDFKAAGLSKEQVMEELKRFSDGFFEYLERHGETLEDGTRLINSVELFNELLVFNPHDKSKNTREVWKEYFGIELKDLYSFIYINDDSEERISRVPDGVDAMYNETMLEESNDRISAAYSLISRICLDRPGLIKVFGNQLHVADTLFDQENIGLLEHSAAIMKRIKDTLGIDVRISEFDLYMSPSLVINCNIHDIDGKYLQLKKYGYLREIERIFTDAGLSFESVDYWSLYDMVDHNLRRSIESKAREGIDISLIDNLHAGLFPKGMDIAKVEALNPKSNKLEHNKGKKYEYVYDGPDNTGHIAAETVIIMVFILIVLFIVLFMLLI